MATKQPLITSPTGQQTDVYGNVVNTTNSPVANPSAPVLQNANVNLDQYGDDSTQTNQVNQPGGNLGKFTGEGVRTSNVDYNPDITTDKLNGKVVFGQEAQQANSKNEGYIAMRNDAIASGLYNEGKVNRGDIEQYLANQPGFTNSTPEERANTIESIRKRLGNLQVENAPQAVENTPQEQMTVEKMGGTPTTTTLFGKMLTGTDFVADPNSPEYLQAQSRVNQYNRINAMNADEIGDMIVNNRMLSGGQTMRDIQQYNPEKYALIKKYIKEKEDVNLINTIAGSKEPNQSSLLQNEDNAINSYLSDTIDANFGGNQEAAASLGEYIGGDAVINSTRAKMKSMVNEIDDIDRNIADLESLARERIGPSATPADIQAYILNRSKPLYTKRNELMKIYNNYKSDIEREVEQKDKEREKWYKMQQLAMNQSQFDQDLSYKYANAGLSAPGTGTMRTERNNNPTAMTTDVARSLGLVEGVDYIQGDPFTTGSGSTLYTARFLGDPIQTTIKALDTAASSGRGAFYTQSGKQRRGHTAMSNEARLTLSPRQKEQVVYSMLQREGGNMKNMSYYANSSNNLVSGAKAEEMSDIILNPKAKDSQIKSFGYANRMYSAIERLNELNIENNFIDRTKFGQYRQNTVPNWMKSNEQQIFESLKENFITALLRQESGAAISNSEFEKEERKYFPMPGDSKETLTEKQKLRELAIKNMYSASGKDENGVPIVYYFKGLETEGKANQNNKETTTKVSPRVESLSNTFYS